MPANTRFKVYQVDTQSKSSTEDALNDLAASDGVDEIVDWETVSADVSRKANLIIEYRPTEEA
jgi:hypothetical protein